MIRAAGIAISATFLFLVLGICVLYWEASSQPANETSEKKTEPGEHKKKATKAKQGTQDNPLVIQVITEDDSKKQADEGKTKRDYKSPEWNAVYVALFLTAFTLGLMIFTAMLWSATTQLMERSEETTKTIERAYVKPSHVSNSFRLEGNGRITIQIQIKNHGTTPARLTDAYIRTITVKKGEKLPEKPKYPLIPPEFVDERPRAFLVKDEFITYTPPIVVLEGRAEAIHQGEARLYMVGYVDYMDQFHKRYRAGYTREYVPNSPFADKLTYAGGKEYNYDRERKKNEGIDWEDDT